MSGAGDPLFESVREIVSRIAGPGRTPESVSPDTRLVEGYWLDSVELLEVIIACETAFEIAFDERRDIPSNGFDTLGSLTELVRAKLASRV